MTLSKRIQAFKCKHDHHKWFYAGETGGKSRVCLHCLRVQFFHPVTYGEFKDYPVDFNPTKTGDHIRDSK